MVLKGVLMHKLKVLEGVPTVKMLMQAAHLCFLQLREVSKVEDTEQKACETDVDELQLPPQQLHDLKESKDVTEHLTHLEAVFELMKANGMYAKLSKCTFGTTKVEYLDHFISNKGVKTDPNKLVAISSWPVPASIKELRSFLGLAGYYRKFVHQYSVISKPLTDQLKKGAFSWNENSHTAFEALKHALISSPVLVVPDFSKEFVVETDASRDGIGAVLMQEKHLIAFISKTLGPKWQKLSVYEKELLTLVFAVQKWEQYLIGGHFIIRTNQQGLKWILEQKLSTPFQQFWLSKLMGFDFEIHYKKGVENVAVDALSRVKSADVLNMAISLTSSELPELIKTNYLLDQTLVTLLQKLEAQEAVPHYKLQQGLILQRGKILVGPDDNLRVKIINWNHSSPESDHSGREITLRRIKAIFKWRGMSKQVKQVVSQCKVCQEAKHENVSSPGLLQPLPIPEDVWIDISMDFINGLPKYGEKDVILVVVDRLSKYAHFMPLSHPYSAL
ncbi:hypothetical protein AgCh_037224 [Apium graveolens]